MQKIEQSLSIHCSAHRNSYYQYISLEKESKQNRLLCAECLFPAEKGNIKKEFIDVIPLSIVFKVFIQALNSPELLVEWMKKDIAEYQKKMVQFIEKDLELEFDEQINKFDQIIKMLEQFQQQIRQQLQEYLKLQAQFKKSRESFFEVFNLFIKKINYNKLCQLLFQLQELDQQYKSDQYSQVAKEFAKTVDEMLKDNCALIFQEIDLIYQDHAKTVVKYLILPISFQKPSDEQFQKQILQLFPQYDQYINKLNENVCSKLSFSQLLKSYYCNTLVQKIEGDSNKQIKQKNLIYQGSRDGLNGNAFWSKVNRKSNLLMIFKSKNNGNYIFGGYSPCKWQINQSKYDGRDDTLTSFLFSQSHNEIYPLKQDRKQEAIYCSQSYGPIFGYDKQDIRIESDFSQGHSYLGSTYYWDQSKGQNSEHLFGGYSPNIEECEIYELIFA